MMTNGPQNARDGPASPAPPDVSPEAAVRKMVRWAWTSPLVLAPGVVGALAAVFTLAIDSSMTSVGLAIFGIAGGLLGLAFNYFQRGPAVTAGYMNEAIQAKQRAEREPIDALVRDFNSVGLSNGAKEAQELDQAFQRCRTVMSRRGPDPQLEYLVGRSYEAGLGVLREALRVARTLQEVDVRALERERTQWEGELTTLVSGMKRVKDSSSLTRLNTQKGQLERRIESHGRRITRFRQLENKVEQLIAESDRIEAELENALLFEAERVDETSLVATSGMSAVDKLSAVVSAAEELQREMQGASSLELGDQHTESERG